jgi:hypothetical protein
VLLMVAKLILNEGSQLVIKSLMLISKVSLFKMIPPSDIYEHIIEKNACLILGHIPCVVSFKIARCSRVVSIFPPTAVPP